MITCLSWYNILGWSEHICLALISFEIFGKGNNDKQYDIYKEILKVEKNVIKYDEDYSYVGIPLSIVKIRGRKTGKKKDNAENNAFVEYNEEQ